MKYLGRFVWFVAVRLLVLVTVLSLAVVVFYYAMHLTNIRIVLTDGMAARAKVVMAIEEEGELSRFFQPAFLESDAALLAVREGRSPYGDYKINGIDHRLEMDFVWIWPWDTSVRVKIVERMPKIDGRIRASKADAAIAASGASALYPPDWQSSRYYATLSRTDGEWRIKNLTWIENVAD